MAWIEVHDNLPDHWKVAALANELGITQAEAIGHLVCLWLWALRYMDDGRVAQKPRAAISVGAKWPGDPDRFVEGLFHTGWLSADDSGLQIHDWFDYAGRLVEKRDANRERKRLSRARHTPVTVTSAPVTRTSDARHAPVTGLHNTTKHNPTNQEEKKDVSFSQTQEPVYRSTPTGSNSHPLIVELRKKNRELGWAVPEAAFGNCADPAKVARIMAEVDEALAGGVALGKLVSVLSAVPGVSVALRWQNASKDIAELKKAAQQANKPAQTQSQTDDYSKLFAEAVRD